MEKYFKETFKAFTAAFVIFAVMELFSPGMVIAYINLNLILILWFLSSIILLNRNA